MATTQKVVNEYDNWEDEYSEKQKRAKKKAAKPPKKHKMKDEEGLPVRNNLKKQKTAKIRERDIKRMMRDY